MQWRETGEIRKFLTFVIRQIASKIFGKNNTEALVISRRLLYPYDDRTDTDFIEYISRHRVPLTRVRRFARQFMGLLTPAPYRPEHKLGK